MDLLESTLTINKQHDFLIVPGVVDDNFSERKINIKCLSVI